MYSFTVRNTIAKWVRYLSQLVSTSSSSRVYVRTANHRQSSVWWSHNWCTGWGGGVGQFLLFSSPFPGLAVLSHTIHSRNILQGELAAALEGFRVACVPAQVFSTWLHCPSQRKSLHCPSWNVFTTSLPLDICHLLAFDLAVTSLHLPSLWAPSLQSPFIFWLSQTLQAV